MLAWVARGAFADGAPPACEQQRRLLSELDLPDIMDCRRADAAPYRAVKRAIGACVRAPLASLADPSGHPIPIYSPECLITVRASRLNPRARSDYQNAWSVIPPAQRRPLWDACAKSSLSWGKLGECLAKQSRRFAGGNGAAAARLFGRWKESAQAILSNAALEIRASLQICSPEADTLIRGGKAPALAGERAGLAGLGEDGRQYRITPDKCTQTGEALRKTQAAVARGIHQLMDSGLRGAFACEGSACPFDVYGYVPADGSEREIQACEKTFGRELYDRMACDPGITSMLPKTVGAINQALQSAGGGVTSEELRAGHVEDAQKGAAGREAFFDLLRREYARNVVRSAWNTLGEGIPIPAACERFGPALRKESADSEAAAGELADGQVNFALLSKMSPEAAIAELDRKVRWMASIEHELKVMTNSVRGQLARQRVVTDENGVRYLAADEQEAIEMYQERIGDILSFAPVLVGKAGVPTALQGGMVRAPTSLDGVRRWRAAGDKAEALKRLLAEHRQLAREQLEKACSRTADGFGWKDLARHDRLVEASLEQVRDGALRDKLGQFHRCVTRDMDRYATAKGAVIAGSMLIPFAGLASAGTATVVSAAALGAGAGMTEMTVAFDDVNSAWKGYRQAQEGFATTSGGAVSAERVDRAGAEFGAAAGNAAVSVAAAGANAAAVAKGVKSGVAALDARALAKRRDFENRLLSEAGPGYLIRGKADREFAGVIKAVDFENGIVRTQSDAISTRLVRDFEIFQPGEAVEITYLQYDGQPRTVRGVFRGNSPDGNRVMIEGHAPISNGRLVRLGSRSATAAASKQGAEAFAAAASSMGLDTRAKAVERVSKAMEEYLEEASLRDLYEQLSKVGVTRLATREAAVDAYRRALAEGKIDMISALRKRKGLEDEMGWAAFHDAYHQAMLLRYRDINSFLEGAPPPGVYFMPSDEPGELIVVGVTRSNEDPRQVVRKASEGRGESLDVRDPEILQAFAHKPPHVSYQHFTARVRLHPEGRSELIVPRAAATDLGQALAPPVTSGGNTFRLVRMPEGKYRVGVQSDQYRPPAWRPKADDESSIKDLKEAIWTASRDAGVMNQVDSMPIEGGGGLEVVANIDEAKRPAFERELVRRVAELKDAARARASRKAPYPEGISKKDADAAQNSGFADDAAAKRAAGLERNGVLDGDKATGGHSILIPAGYSPSLSSQAAFKAARESPMTPVRTEKGAWIVYSERSAGAARMERFQVFADEEKAKAFTSTHVFISH